jgi:hypothetical protein
MSDIVYTRHAQEKFAILARYGFEVKPEQVEDTVTSPERVIPQAGGKFIAQKGITEQHLLRVVFSEEGQTYVIITFYPGRKDRYEN